MPTLAMTFFAISLIAAVLGVGGMANPISVIAELTFLLFAALFVLVVLFSDMPAGRSVKLGARGRRNRM